VTALVLLLACTAAPSGGGKDTAPPSTTSTTTPAPTTPAPTTSTTPTTPTAVQADCAVQPDNALRVDCTVRLDLERPVRITATQAGGWEREVASPAGVAHSLTLWGLYAEQDVAWTAWVDGVALAEGVVRTGAIPPLLAELNVTLAGDDPVVEHVLVPASCEGAPFLAIVDRDGAVVWYQDLEWDGEGSVGLANLTDDGGVVVIVDEGIQEWSLTGEHRRTLERGVHFDRRIHHDLFKHDDILYALWADTVEVGRAEVVLDGLYLFDEADAVVGEWSLADHISLEERDLVGLPPRGFWEDEFPGAVDWSHANAVFVDDDGITVSTRWISTVWRLAGFDSPRFGEVEWRLVGEQDSPIPADFVLESGLTDVLGFRGQHHATVSPGGLLSLFDNRRGADPSRALAYALDPSAGVAELVAVHTLPQHCDVQGGAFIQDNGDMVATCADTGVVYHYRAGGDGAESFSMGVQCGDFAGVRVVMPRAQPVAL
jgi:hypothetical protein